MAKLVRIQLVGFYFRCCAMEKSNEERVASWAKELQDNIQLQKQRVVECMPSFIRMLKLDFDTAAIPAEHWWRLIKEGDRGPCLAVVNSRPWIYKTGLTHGTGDINRLCKSSGTGPCPWQEWRFERPLLVDREPKPKTSAERHPTADPRAGNAENTELQKDYEAELTFVLSRFTHKRLLIAHDEIAPLGDRVWEATMETRSYNESLWYHRNIRWKVVPTKGKPVSTFKLLAIMPSDTRAWKALGLGSYNPFAADSNTEWYLEDQGTSQDDF